MTKYGQEYWANRLRGSEFKGHPSRRKQRKHLAQRNVRLLGCGVVSVIAIEAVVGMIENVYDFNKERHLAVLQSFRFVEADVESLVGREADQVSFGRQVVRSVLQCEESRHWETAAIVKLRAQVDSRAQPVAQVTVEGMALVLVGREMDQGQRVEHFASAEGVGSPTSPTICTPFLNEHFSAFGDARESVGDGRLKIIGADESANQMRIHEGLREQIRVVALKCFQANARLIAEPFFESG